MNEHAILHIPDSRYCFATAEKELVLRLRMAREDEDAKVYLIYAQKYDFSLKREKLKMEISYSDRLYNYYEVKLKLEDVRFAYVFQIEKDGETYYFSEDGTTKTYCFEEGFYNFFQMPYINKNDVLEVVDWMRHRIGQREQYSIRFLWIALQKEIQQRIPLTLTWSGEEFQHRKTLLVETYVES